MAEKQFKIKYGVLKRVNKDFTYYQNEYTKQNEKIIKMKQEGKDSHDIKQQEQVLQETETMLPDCESRIKKALQDLNEFMDKNKSEIETHELFQEAQELVQQLSS